MRWFFAAPVVLIFGCPMFVPPPGDGAGGVACTEVFVYGINLTLTDNSGAPVSGANVTLTSGDFSETMQELGAGVYVGVGERAGTYSMMIEAGGFASQTMTGIVVNEDECHVIPVMLDVTLSAAG